MDIIGDLAAGRLSEVEATEALDALEESWRQNSIGDLGAVAGMSAAELTAYLRGAPLADIASWRIAGWPTACCLCGGALDSTGDNWMVPVGPHSGALLIHLNCSLPPLPQPICPTPPDVEMYRLVLSDDQFVAAETELDRLLAQLADGELERWQVIGFVESGFVEAVILATVKAHEQVYGPNPNRAMDDLGLA